MTMWLWACKRLMVSLSIVRNWLEMLCNISWLGPVWIPSLLGSFLLGVEIHGLRTPRRVLPSSSHPVRMPAGLCSRVQNLIQLADVQTKNTSRLRQDAWHEAAGSKIVDSPKHIFNLANIGDARSLAIHRWPHVSSLTIPKTLFGGDGRPHSHLPWNGMGHWYYR